MLLLGIFTALVLVFPVLAEDDPERPKGLDDRGPLTKITVIHYRKGYAKPPQPGKPKPATCYGFLANGAKWKTNEDYLVNPNNSDELRDNFVMSAIEAGVTKWEKYGGNIFGTGTKDLSVSYDKNLDYKNTASFGTYSDPNVIAITSVWGYFGGPPQTRQLVEWDILFNTGSDWTWGDALENPSLMDLQNIATHELGHSAGMDDLYTTACNLETMYGYSTEGETIKRDLNPGDIAGITILY